MLRAGWAVVSSGVVPPALSRLVVGGGVPGATSAPSFLLSASPGGLDALPGVGAGGCLALLAAVLPAGRVAKVGWQRQLREPSLTGGCWCGCWVQGPPAPHLQWINHHSSSIHSINQLIDQAMLVQEPPASAPAPTPGNNSLAAAAAGAGLSILGVAAAPAVFGGGVLGAA